MKQLFFRHCLSERRIKKVYGGTDDKSALVGAIHWNYSRLTCDRHVNRNRSPRETQSTSIIFHNTVTHTGIEFVTCDIPSKSLLRDL